MKKGHNGARDRVECGGYSSKQMSTESLAGRVKDLKKLSLYYDTETIHLRFIADLEAGPMEAEVTVRDGSEPFGGTSCKRSLKEGEAGRLEQAVLSTRLLEYNGYNVHVNGLPLIEECSLSMTFAEGDAFHLSFNGGHGPGGFTEELMKMWPLLFEMAGYAPGKCIPPTPGMSSLVGTHRFEYVRGEKKGTLTIRLDSMYRRKDAESQGELFSEGDFGKKHFLVNTSYVTTGNGRWDVYLVRELEDSIGVTPDSWKFAAMLEREYDGRLRCEALSAMPDLEDRTAAYEIEPVEMLASAFCYRASEDTYKTMSLLREDDESMEYFLRSGSGDPKSGRFFYTVRRADPDRLRLLEKLAIASKLSDIREYLALGSEAPAVSPFWLKLNFRYGRSVILSEDRIQAAAERLKDPVMEEMHRMLLRQLCQLLADVARPEDALKQGVCPSCTEVVEQLQCGIATRIDIRNLSSEMKERRRALGVFSPKYYDPVLYAEIPVEDGQILTADQLMEKLNGNVTLK